MPESYGGPRWQSDPHQGEEFIDPNDGGFLPPPTPLPPRVPPMRPRLPFVLAALVGAAVIAVVAVLSAQASPTAPLSEPSDLPLASSSAVGGFPSGAPTRQLPPGPSGLPSADSSTADQALISLDVSAFVEGLDLGELRLLNGAMCSGAQLDQAQLDAFGAVADASAAGTPVVTGSTATAAITITTTSGQTASHTLALIDPDHSHFSWCINAVQ